ncbi:hypothetical protein DNH61_19890 [Paenibacillus sambharensis]|uniref:Calx-beta domain-containing protein n=1 Tax=Paenibacillus sambharensis TaxID=1803190 RepID=A0A2W1LGQ9_9BACL|nr:Calx-beta domain-containing protein [Paenibacillus sambharensis]PZD94205.1 hypothetical protein DNH61_19890 [Paenibacillus sambharensis]
MKRKAALLLVTAAITIATAIQPARILAQDPPVPDEATAAAPVTAQAEDTAAVVRLTDFDYSTGWKDEDAANYYGQNEEDGDRRIQVMLEGRLGSGKEAVVSYKVEQLHFVGPAASACGYAQVPPQEGTLTFTDEQHQQEITVPITNDEVSECIEYYTVSISPKTDNVVVPHQSATAELYVFDDDESVVTFTRKSNRANPWFDMVEDGQLAVRPWQTDRSIMDGIIILGDRSKPVTVDLKYIDCCAKRNEDYTSRMTKFSPHKFSFDRDVEYTRADNPFTKFGWNNTHMLYEPNRLFGIIDDEKVELKPEGFKIVLSNPVNTSIGAVDSGYITIRDNDRPSFYFKSQYMYGTYQFSKTLTVTVMRSDGEGEASVTLTPKEDHLTQAGEHWMAKPGVEYDGTPQKIRFAPGETQKTVEIPLYPNGYVAPFSEMASKYFLLELKGASKGYRALHTGMVTVH